MLIHNTLLMFALQTVATAASNQSPLVRLEWEGETFRATCDDSEVRIEYTATVPHVDEPNAVHIDARHLLAIAKNLPAGDVEIRATPNRLKVVGGRAEYVLCLSGKDLPPSTAHDLLGSFTVPDAAQALSIAAPVAPDEDDARYGLNGLALERVGDRLRFVATDGSRLTWAEVEAAIPAGALPPRMLLPRSVARLWSKLSGPVLVEMSERAIRLSAGPIVIQARLLEGEFPAYRAVLPAHWTRRATVEREPFLSALRRVALTATDKARTIRITVKPDALALHSNAVDHGEADEEVQATVDGDPITMGFNVTFLLDAVGAITAQTIHLEMNEALSPVVLRPEPDPGDAYWLVMPIRLE